MSDESREIRSASEVPPGYSEADGWNPLNRGYILYPQENREKRKYHIPIPDESEQRRSISPIAWSDSSSKIAFMEAYRNESFLVVIDVSQGLARPGVGRLRVDKSRFYKEAVDWRPEYDTAVVVARALRFADGEKAVVVNSRESGPFGAKEIKIRIE